MLIRNRRIDNVLSPQTGEKSLNYIKWYIYIYVCVCVCVCIHTHIYICIHTHIYIYTHIHTHKYRTILQFPVSEKLMAFNLGPWPLSKISVTNITACERPKWLCYSLEDRRIETWFPVGPVTCLVATAFCCLWGKQASFLRMETGDTSSLGNGRDAPLLTFKQFLVYECVQYTSIPQYSFTALRLIKQRNIFNFLHTEVTSFVTVTTNHSPGSHSRLLYAVCIMQLGAASH